MVLRRKAKYIILALILLALVYVFTSSRGVATSDVSSPEQAGNEIEVSLVPVVHQPLDKSVEVTGSLFGNEEATISAKVSGRLLVNHVDVGDRVEPGQILAELDPTDYQLLIQQRQMELNEATAKLGSLKELPADFDVSKVVTVERAKLHQTSAKTRFDRAKQLFTAQPPLLSEQDYQDLETAYQVAKRDYEVAILEARSQLAVVQTRVSELSAADQRLKDSKTLAPDSPAMAKEGPYTYAVARRYVSPGEYVPEGAPLFDLVLDDPIKFRAAVPERFLADVKIGQQVQVRIESYKEVLKGQLDRIGPAIDPQSRAFQIEVTVPNGQGLLKSGAFAQGKIVIGTDPAVPFVPKTAVASFAGVDRVYSVRDGKAVEHRVSLGIERSNLVAIISGLAGVEQVINENVNSVSADHPVRVGAAG